MDDIYELADGNGNPPYTLYQNEMGEWGLIDKDGIRLEAIYDRREDASFYIEEFEYLYFNPMKGFCLKEENE